MRLLLLVLTAGCVLASCAPPTPDVFELYKTSVPVTETAQAKIGEFYDCVSVIDDQVNQLETTGQACNQDYDCRNKIAGQIEKLSDKFTTTCIPMNPSQVDRVSCESNLIKARGAYVHGAPLETGPNKLLAEDYLASQVDQAYKNCFANMENYNGP